MQILILFLFLITSCATQKVAEKTPGFEEVYNTTLELDWLNKAVTVSNCTINLPVVKSEIESIKKFDFTSDTGLDVARKLYTLKVQVETYKTHWLAPWKNRVIAHAKDQAIFLNTRTNPRTMPEMVATLFHEYAHSLGYGHGSNGSHVTGVPFEMEKLGRKYAKECMK